MNGIQVIEEPFDDYERSLVQTIRLIHEDAMRQAQPFVDRLAQSRACKPPRYLVDTSLLRPEFIQAWPEKFG